MATVPTVSIVIPNYNYAHFLDERFQSILAQGRDGLRDYFS